jgi:hypothetical protein
MQSLWDLSAEDRVRLDVLVEVAVQIVVGRHRMLLAALVMQPDPAAAPLTRK